MDTIILSFTNSLTPHKELYPSHKELHQDFGCLDPQQIEECQREKANFRLYVKIRNRVDPDQVEAELQLRYMSFLSGMYIQSTIPFWNTLLCLPQAVHFLQKGAFRRHQHIRCQSKICLT